jgi:hypothetical protein
MSTCPTTIQGSPGWSLKSGGPAKLDTSAMTTDTEAGDEIKEGDADGFSKRVKDHSPLKAHWFVPIKSEQIAEKPNMSNSDLKHIILATM